MKAIYTCFLCLIAASLPAVAQKVFIDYDNATAFSQYRTYQFKETREDLRDTYPDAHRDVVVKLKKYIQEGGMEEVQSNPDVYVAYYTADYRDLRLVLGDLEYTYGPDFSFGGYWEGGVGTRTPNSFQFREGTLIIDVWDAEEKQLVFRGIATAALAKNTEKNVEKLDKALEKIIKQWGEMKGDRVRAIRKLQEEEGD
jgi:hypothetical protein